MFGLGPSGSEQISFVDCCKDGNGHLDFVKHDKLSCGPAAILSSEGMCFTEVTDMRVNILDVHESVHRDMVMKVTNNMQLYRLIYNS
jgi:hypothetical protein